MLSVGGMSAGKPQAKWLYYRIRCYVESDETAVGADLMRGVNENPAGRSIWWIHYYAAGKRHRERVGRKSDAVKLYQSRKADAAAGRKLPELRNSKVVSVSELIDDALEFVAHHKDNRNYKSKGEIVGTALGSRQAAEVTLKN